MQTPRKEVKSLKNVVRYRNDGDFYFSYGIKAFQKRRFDRAEKWLHKAIDTSPTNPLYLCQLSVLYTETGKYHQANEILQKVIDYHDHTYADCYYLLANNYAHLGLFYEARKYANKYIEHEPEGDFIEDVNELLELLNHVAQDDLDDDLDFDDEDELIIYQETAFYHMEHQEWDEAIEVLEEMILFHPEYITAKHDYAFALFQKGDREEALALEESWFEQDPFSLHSRLNLIYFYYKLKKYDQVESLAYVLGNVYPTYDAQKLKMAITLARIGNYKDALERFRLVNKVKFMNHPSYYYWLAKVLKENGYINESEKIWLEGIKKHSVLPELEE